MTQPSEQTRLWRKKEGAYAGSLWRETGMEKDGKAVLEAVAIPGLLHIFSMSQMEAAQQPARPAAPLPSPSIGEAYYAVMEEIDAAEAAFGECESLRRKVKMLVAAFRDQTEQVATRSSGPLGEGETNEHSSVHPRNMPPYLDALARASVSTCVDGSSSTYLMVLHFTNVDDLIAGETAVNGIRNRVPAWTALVDALPEPNADAAPSSPTTGADNGTDEQRTAS